jgi:very-short-patch-repair endonuclease
MHELLVLIGILVLLSVVSFVVKIVLPGLMEGKSPLPYQKETVLFTPAERSFLSVLEAALGDQFRVMGEVRLADVIKVKSGLSRSLWQQAFNRIQGKHLDFVVCDPNDMSVQFVVELDDSSHQQTRRQVRDEFLDKALAAAGVPIFHFSAKRTYFTQDIQRAIFEQPNPERHA